MAGSKSLITVLWLALTAGLTLPAAARAHDCSAKGLDLCLSFESGTRFSKNQVRIGSVDRLVTLFAHNKAEPFPPGDRADDETRLSLVEGGRDGRHALRFTTQDDDSGVHKTRWERSEVMLRADDTGALPGVEQWWAHSVYFPPDFRVAPGAYRSSIFFQFKQEITEGQPLVALDVFMEPGRGGPRAILRVINRGAGGGDQHAQYFYRTNGRANVKGQCLHDPFELGVWYDFVHRIRWSYTGTGSHEIWMRKAGAPTKKVLARSGINTLYGNGRAYLKFGTYHDPVPGKSSVIADRIRRGSSFAAVAMPDFRLPPDTVVACSNSSL
jgi:hypothetical protein